MRLFLVLSSVLLLASCGGQRKQYASDAIAGIDAARSGLIDLDTVYNPIAQLIASSADSKLIDLPEPTIPPREIAQRMGEYRAAAEQSQLDVGFWAEVLAWSGGALAVALGLARTLGVGGPLVGVAEQILLSKQTRKQNEKRKQLGSVGGLAIEIIESLDSKPLKEAINKRVTTEQALAIEEELLRQAQARVI